MLKLKHLRHPFRAAVTAANLVAMHLQIRSLGRRYRRHFQSDGRYDLGNVANGLRSCPADTSDDTALLERICAAYAKAIERERSTPPIYQASGWWQQVRNEHLGPVLRALESGDIRTLGAMYANFYRDPCATGLVAVPYGMYKACFGPRRNDALRHYILGDALYYLDYWRAQTQGRFSLPRLASPDIGNPFGVVLDRTLVRTGAAYQHDSACKVAACIDSGAGVVAEIGGGYGGMAYYLLRDRPGVTYIDFDVPESIALASYYLIKAFPQLTFRLYGEEPETHRTFSSADVALLPLSEMQHLPSASVDVFFSSHAMSDLPTAAVDAYLKVISRAARRHFIYIGSAIGAEAIRTRTARGKLDLCAEQTRPSAWNTHRHIAAEVECLYVAASARRTSSARAPVY